MMIKNTFLIKTLSWIVFVNVFAPQLQADKTEDIFSSRKEVNFSWASSIYTKAIDSIVTLHQVGEHGQIHGMGTGFFIEKNLVVTCYHVVGDSHNIQATLSNNKVISVLGVESADKLLDVAILRTELCDVLPLKLTKTQPALGKPILAIGNPRGLRGSVTPGVISGNRVIDGKNMMQVAVPIEKGNSGGPLLDSEGNVCGILTYKSSLTRNLGFAIPSTDIDKIKKFHNYRSMEDWLGLSAINLDLWCPTTKNTWQKKHHTIETNCSGESITGRSICWSLNAKLSGSIQSEVWLNFNDETGGAGLSFKFDNEQGEYGAFISESKLWLVYFKTKKVKDWEVLKTSSAFGWRKNDWNQLAINRKSNQIVCSLNGVGMLSYGLNKQSELSRLGLIKLGKSHVSFRALGLNKFEHMPFVYNVAEETQNLDLDKLIHLEDPLRMEMYSDKLFEDIKFLELRAKVLKTKNILNKLSKLVSKPNFDIFEACVLGAHAANPNAATKLIRTMWGDVFSEILLLTNKPSSSKEKVAIIEKYFSGKLRWNTVANSQVSSCHHSVIDVWENRELSKSLKDLLVYHIIRHSSNFVENDILSEPGQDNISVLITINPKVKESVHQLIELLLNQNLSRFDTLSIPCLNFFISQNYNKSHYLFYRGWIKISSENYEEGLEDWAIVKEITSLATVTELIAHALEFNLPTDYAWMRGLN